MGMIQKLENVCWMGDNARLYAGTILLKDGRIAKLQGERLARNMRDDEQLLLPGLIDPHVHLREPGQVYKEGIANGTAAALKGGVTTVLDMPNNVPPCVTVDDLNKKRKLFAQKSRVNYGLFLQAQAESPAMPITGIAGVKVYMAKSSVLSAIAPEQLARVFRGQRRVVVHAEDESRFVAVRGRKASPHHERRPRESITSALDAIAKAYVSVPETWRPRIVIAHCSTKDEVEWVARMKRSGHDIWAETCPHYFLFTEEDYLAQGSRLQVNPPLRSAADRDAVWEALKNGIIDFVSSDHAPHLPKEKAGGSAPPSGIAGIEWLGPLLISMVARKELSWARYLELAGQQAAKCFDIPDRGTIKAGQWADLVAVAAGPPDAGVVTRAEWNPYAGFEFEMHVQSVMVGGQWALLNGRLQRGVHGREVYA